MPDVSLHLNPNPDPNPNSTPNPNPNGPCHLLFLQHKMCAPAHCTNPSFDTSGIAIGLASWLRSVVRACLGLGLGPGFRVRVQIAHAMGRHGLITCG